PARTCHEQLRPVSAGRGGGGAVGIGRRRTTAGGIAPEGRRRRRLALHDLVGARLSLLGGRLRLGLLYDGVADSGLAFGGLGLRRDGVATDPGLLRRLVAVVV